MIAATPSEPTRPPEPWPLTPGEALARLFLDNADRGANHANDELVEALRQRVRKLQVLVTAAATHPTLPEPKSAALTAPLKRRPERLMPGLAEITLVGMLVTDPELSVGPGGATVARFTVAANDGHCDRVTGEWVDKGVTFLPCAIGNQAAENVVGSLTKGARVLVTGVLRQREWETTDSDKRYAYEVDATEVGVSLTWAAVTVKPAPRSDED